MSRRVAWLALTSSVRIRTSAVRRIMWRGLLLLYNLTSSYLLTRVGGRARLGCCRSTT